MKNWRPKGWKNPNKTFAEGLRGTDSELNAIVVASAFEAGADAMLQALRKGEYVIAVKPGTAEVTIPLGKDHPTLRFIIIPDDEAV